LNLELKQLGPYTIGETLGKGGMGTVYAGVHQTTGQRVAVKVLNPQFAVAEGFRERFETEIESLKKLHHESIVQLYGYGQQQCVLFYSMELVDGPSLEDELHAGRRFGWREVTEIAIDVSKALKHAHDHGIIHRDLKPANLLLAKNGRVKLSDFGIARLFGATQLTYAGGLLGTAEFMSPEQADGRAVNDRCDQYSLGGVLYTLLAAKPPFRARSMPEMLQLQRFAHPEPIGRLAPDTPQELQRIVTQLMAKDPAERFANTGVVARQLEAMLHALSRPLDQDFATGDISAVRHDVPISLAETIDAGPPASPARPSGADMAADHPGVDPAASPSAADPPDGDPSSAGSPQAAAVDEDGRQKTDQNAPHDDHFILLEDQRRRAESSQHWTLSAVLQTLGLVAALLAIVLGIWYFSLPQSADALYQSISEAAARAEPQPPVAAEGELRQFLRRFPEDQRAARVAALLEDVEIDQLERRLRTYERSAAADERLTSAERLYLDAMSLAESDPPQAIAQLTALANLYGPLAVEPSSPDADARRNERCARLAQRQLDRLSAKYEQQNARARQELEEKISQARDLLTTNPERARSMFQAIIDLYGDEPWAADLVKQARAELKR